MQDTVKALIESSVEPNIDFYTKNRSSLNMLDSITESEKMSMGFTAQKVLVQKSPEDNRYLVEYANNLEKFMLEQDIGIKEAMSIIADINEIPVDECAVVFDESCVNKIDIGAVITLDPDFDIVRM